MNKKVAFLRNTHQENGEFKDELRGTLNKLPFTSHAVLHLLSLENPLTLTEIWVEQKKYARAHGINPMPLKEVITGLSLLLNHEIISIEFLDGPKRKEKTTSP